MNKTKYLFLFSLLLTLVFVACAKRGTPEGGPEDFTPPQFVRASPENFTTNFDAKEIRIYFDEYIKLNEAQRQIIVSPPMDPKPEITPLGTASKSITIKIHDTLQPNTTYAINFGRSIQDNNAGNPLSFFQYIFSTGSYIDSLSVSGSIKDAYLKETPPFISVMLYEVDSTYNDSTVYKNPPRYITNTLDSLTTFQLNYLKEGTYKMVALNDLNNNYQFNPEKEKIAFLEGFITLPTDSVFELSLFQEIPDFAAGRPKQVAGQHLIFGFTGDVEPDSLDISLNPVPEDFEHRISLDREKDTLHYWFKPELERDSLQFIVEAPDYRDSLLTRRTEMERDSLVITFEPSGTLDFNQSVRILPSIPLDSISESQISLTDQDTLTVPFTLTYDAFRNSIQLDFEKKESQRYNFQALPGAFTDFFGNVNDTLTTQFRTLTVSDYGNVVVNLQNVKQYPVIVQLTNEGGEMQAEQTSTSGTSFSFSQLKPGPYYIRVIYDSNKNGKWDTGSFLGKTQPEEIVYFPDPLDVRANWDVTQTVDLQ